MEQKFLDESSKESKAIEQKVFISPELKKSGESENRTPTSPKIGSLALRRASKRIQDWRRQRVAWIASSGTLLFGSLIWFASMRFTLKFYDNFEWYAIPVLGYPNQLTQYYQVFTIV